VSDHPHAGAGSAPLPAVDAEWDAGDLGCGELVLELRMRMGAMRSGQVLRLTAHDPGAPQDLPAWCRMTGHTLVSQQHPVYLIRRR
jgi:tRNA 2-thiouridine synthesizing protein A